MPSDSEGLTARRRFSRSETDERPVGRRGVAIDLFSGAGGFSLGAIEAGLEVLAAIEMNPHACDSYRRNLLERCQSNTRLYRSRIEDVDPLDVMSELKIAAGACDLVIGGPPCQGFSTHRINGAGVNDPRNQLLIRYFDYIRAIRPRAFLVENVPGLLWDRHSFYLRSFYSLARSNGYEVFAPVVLQAAAFGVPQNRKRVFILGIRSDVAFTESWPPHSSPELMVSAQARLNAIFDDAPVNDPNNKHMKHSEAVTNRLIKTPINGGSRRDVDDVLACHERHDGHSDVYGRIDPRRFGPTMTTACINPSKGRFAHPVEPHGITIRQAARYQTFPDWFVFEGGLMAAGEQIGNAVPVAMATEMISYIIDALSAPDGSR